MHPISPGERTSHFTPVPPPKQKSLKPLRFLLIFSSVLIFLLITLGGIVRVTDSGLACPDWPLCHGKFIPPKDLSIYIEYSHRLTATVVSVMLFITTVVIWVRHRYLQTVKTLLLISLGLLTLQIALGAITVIKELPPHVVTAHLAIAELIFASVILALVWTKSYRTILISPDQKKIVSLVLLGILGTYIVILSGSYIVGDGSGPSCPSWPLCDGGLFPSTSSGLVHMSHRILAGVTSLLVGYLCFYILTNRGLPRIIRITGIHIGVFFALQILVGAANPWSQFSPIFKALHLSLATALWGGVIVLLGLLWQPKSNT
mgnify:CR=1 FL=1